MMAHYPLGRHMTSRHSKTMTSYQVDSQT